jgi:hypothetical protein
LLALWHLLGANREQIEHHQPETRNSDGLLARSPAKVVGQPLLLEERSDPVDTSDTSNVVAAHGLEVDGSLSVSEYEFSEPICESWVLRLGVCGPVGDGFGGGQECRFAVFEEGEDVLPVGVVEVVVVVEEVVFATYCEGSRW